MQLCACTIAGLMMPACTEPTQIFIDVQRQQSGPLGLLLPGGCAVLTGSFCFARCFLIADSNAAALPELPLLPALKSHAELCDICFAMGPSFKPGGLLWHTLHQGCHASQIVRTTGTRHSAGRYMISLLLFRMVLSVVHFWADFCMLF